MYGLHPEMGFKGVIIALILEVVFLGFCLVFVGLGVSEIRKRKNYLQNLLLIAVGLSLALISAYMTSLFLEG